MIKQLGHKPADAKKMIAKAMKRNDSITTAEELFDEVYKGERMGEEEIELNCNIRSQLAHDFKAGNRLAEPHLR